ncbi:hypothetical protein [Actinomadura formosensis]|uniref:hypothetical protein n=1 Tax=Actinomadura formosensis TaxID=60706 RepID=UPI003D92497D
MTEFDETGQPMMDIARGDQRASMRIRRDLEVLKDNSANPEFQRLVQDVLAGRRSLREAAGSAIFGAEMSPRIDQVEEKWQEAMAEDQEVVDEEQVEQYRRLQAEARNTMREITEKLQELQRLQDDLDAG